MAARKWQKYAYASHTMVFVHCEHVLLVAMCVLLHLMTDAFNWISKADNQYVNFRASSMRT